MRLLVLAAAGLSTPLLLAGPYSSATSNSTPGAPDPGIPGFVGPDGAGAVTANNYVNPVFKGWATSVVNYTPSLSATQPLDAQWRDSSLALGPVTGIYADVVSLGELTAGDLTAGKTPGSIVLQFAGGIRNGAGADFAIFENALGSDLSVFVELGFVEVSSNGSDFARFPSVTLTSTPVSQYAQMDPTTLYNFAGKHANGNGKSWGTPFDLADLASDPLVTSGKVDLGHIAYARIVDIPGTGAFTDSQGHPIYDPTNTFGSGGLDLEAVGVINAVPEPTTIGLGAAVWLLALSQRRHTGRGSL